MVFIFNSIFKGEDVYKSFKWVDTTNFDGKSGISSTDVAP